MLQEALKRNRFNSHSLSWNPLLPELDPTSVQEKTQIQTLENLNPILQNSIIKRFQHSISRYFHNLILSLKTDPWTGKLTAEEGPCADGALGYREGTALQSITRMSTMVIVVKIHIRVRTVENTIAI